MEGGVHALWTHVSDYGVCLMSIVLLDPKQMNGSAVDDMKSVIFKPHLRISNEETQKIAW